MFNLGMGEILVLLIIALVVVGPEKLPKLARNISSFLNEIKRTTNTIGSEFNTAMEEKSFEGEESLKDSQKTEDKS